MRRRPIGGVSFFYYFLYCLGTFLGLDYYTDDRFELNPVSILLSHHHTFPAVT